MHPSIHSCTTNALILSPWHYHCTHAFTHILPIHQGTTHAHIQSLWYYPCTHPFTQALSSLLIPPSVMGGNRQGRSIGLTCSPNRELRILAFWGFAILLPGFLQVLLWGCSVPSQALSVLSSFRRVLGIVFGVAHSSCSPPSSVASSPVSSAWLLLPGLLFLLT